MSQHALDSAALDTMPIDALKHARPPVRLFESDLLERFTRTRVTSVILFWLPVSGGALGLGIGQGWLAGPVVATLVVAGVAAWMLVEYLLHRFVFHLDRWIPATARFCFLIHGCHHADPNDGSRDIMPPVASAPMLGLVLGVAVWALGLAGGLVFFGAFSLAYLAYDVTHYGCHQWSLPGRIGTYLQRHHLLHHYRDGTRHFGVTSPVWDWVFGTLRLSRPHG
jgi:sterol desaturase/sphingolipid hydroxylase (fatty acid hydroxylase superfamily)